MSWTSPSCTALCKTVSPLLFTAVTHSPASSKNLTTSRRGENPFSGKVVIFDRYVCDSSAWLSFWYGTERRFRLQKWILRTLSPTPLRAFFLNVRPEIALIRKGEMSLAELRRMVNLYGEESKRLGVRVLDGEEPPAKVAAEIAREVWTSLPPQS